MKILEFKLRLDDPRGLHPRPQHVLEYNRGVNDSQLKNWAHEERKNCLPVVWVCS